MRRRLGAIIRREYLERVKTKGFVVGTILGPLLMAGLMIIPVIVSQQGGKPLRVAVLATDGGLQSPVEEALRGGRVEGKARFEVAPAAEGSWEEREALLKQAVLEARIDGYLELPAGAVPAGTATYVGRSVGNRLDLRLMERLVGDVLVARRLADVGVDPARIPDLTRGLDMRRVRLSAAGAKEDRGAALLFAIILLMILYTSILSWGQVVMSSVIEEKGSRVVEVMAASVSPSYLLAGKLIGVGGAGLTQFLAWSLSLSGLAVGASGPLLGAVPLPEITPLVLVSFVLFFLLGFAFYASLYAAIGAAVNTVQEAQNLLFPVILPLILGAVTFPTVLEAPDGTLAVVLSLIPFLSPLLMFLRIVVLTPPWWQIVLSFALLVLSILAVIRISARVYRTGILMYGKKPTLPELVRWVRHS